MKILIISPNIGRTAPGIVFEKLILGLAQYHEIDVCTSDYSPKNDFAKVHNTILIKKMDIPVRIQNFFISYFSANFFDKIWAYRIKSRVKNDNQHTYDLILSFVSFNHYIALAAGVILSKKYGCKFAIYTVDAIPAPIGWMNKGALYNGLRTMMSNYIYHSNLFFSSNKSMLKYQLSLLEKHNENLLSDVIYTPGGERIVFPFINDGYYNFIYTGGIYGLRTANHLIEGFSKLLEGHPKSKLIFIGTDKFSLNLNKYNTKVIENIEVLPYLSDLSYYYSKATALIDIDAEIENDVFLSSKMTNYIMVNRMIICQTGEFSPSRELFNGIDSIIQAKHDSTQMYNSMLTAILRSPQVDYSDRDEVIASFSVDEIVSKFNEKLDKLISDKI